MFRKTLYAGLFSALLASSALVSTAQAELTPAEAADLETQIAEAIATNAGDEDALTAAIQSIAASAYSANSDDVAGVAQVIGRAIMVAVNDLGVAPGVAGRIAQTSSSAALLASVGVGDALAESTQSEANGEQLVRDVDAALDVGANSVEVPQAVAVGFLNGTNQNEINVAFSQVEVDGRNVVVDQGGVTTVDQGTPSVDGDSGETTTTETTTGGSGGQPSRNAPSAAGSTSIASATGATANQNETSLTNEQASQSLN